MLLYSTNTALKHRFNRDFFGNVHYCWCSPVFDASKLAAYARGATTPPSSDPCTIYRDLALAVQRSDEHCAKISEQKATLMALATKFHLAGRITEDERDEMISMIGSATFTDWRPYLYVIPNNGFGTRLKVVPRSQRASNELEYIIEDLKESEFHILEFPR